MKVLGILGSPRIGGNTDILLSEALKGAASSGGHIEKIYLGDLKFQGCIECGGCDKTAVCVLSDDMTAIYKKLRQADIIVLASPIFFAGITSQLKAMIDRCQSEWVGKYKLKVKSPWPTEIPCQGRQKSKVKDKKAKGAFVCVAGHKKNIFFEAAKKPVEAFFKTMNVENIGELFFGGVEKAGDIKNLKGALKKAYMFGRRLVKAGMMWI